MNYNKKNLKLCIGILIMCMAFILSAYQEAVIEDFSKGKVQKWVPKKKAAIKFILKPETGTMKVDLPDTGVNWVFCYLKKAADLKKYPYIEIKIRALKPGFHKYYFYINKKSKEYGAQAFHTILCLKGEKEHTFLLDTTRQGNGSRGAAKGYFVYNKGKIRSLKPGGVVRRFAFTSTLNGADFELKSIKMLSERPSNKIDTDKSKTIKGTLISPYKFKRHLKGKELVVVENGKSEYKIAMNTKFSWIFIIHCKITS